MTEAGLLPEPCHIFTLSTIGELDLDIMIILLKMNNDEDVHINCIFKL